MTLKFKWETEFKETEIGETPKDWEVRKIGIVAKVNEELINKNYNYKIIEYIDINSVESGLILEKKVIPLEIAPTRARRVVRNNDILLSTVRPNLRHYAFVKYSKPNTIASTGFAVIRARNIAPRYLYYYITTDFVTEYLTQIAETHTSAYPSFTPDVVENLKTPYPSPHEQSRIATVLSWFDDLIENKKRQNEILEKVAMAIFKSWFVDFEPFKDEEFVYSEELGKEIPEGWEVDFATRLIDYNPSIRLEKEEVYPFVEMKQVYTNSAVCEFSFRKFNGSGVKYYGGDTLMARITPSLEHGKTAFVWFISENEKGFGTTEFFVLHPKKSWLKEFIYLLAKNEDFRDTAINSMTGTSGRQRADVEALKSYLIPIPPPLILQKFHSLVEPLFQKIILNQKQTMILRKIRDTLLPKLVFGKLRVEVLR